MATLEQSVNPILQAKTVLAANGRIVIPAAIREALGFKPGETLVMHSPQPCALRRVNC